MGEVSLQIRYVPLVHQTLDDEFSIRRLPEARLALTALRYPPYGLLQRPDHAPIERTSATKGIKSCCKVDGTADLVGCTGERKLYMWSITVHRH